MTVLEWDRVTERRYEAGVDRGVLFLPDNRAVPWNGLLSVEEGSTVESQSYYIDGVKYLERQIPGDFVGKLRAFTYPDEFGQLLGVRSFARGFLVHDQPVHHFSLAYRTRLGNDVDGSNHGYKIHLIYNVLANPDPTTFNTIGPEVTPSEFAWSLSATPEIMAGFKPTAHLSFDSTQIHPEALAALEDRLYGTEATEPSLPTIQEIIDLFASIAMIVITDNGDGTWTASGPDEYITMLDATTFEITGVNATYLDADTYVITNTDVS